MATILDTFFVRLGFEVDQKGLAEARAGIANIGHSLLGLAGLGLSFAGLSALTIHTAEAMAQVELLSERSGLATETIAGMTKAGMQFDITAESMSSGLEYLNGQLGLIAQGAPTRLKMIMKAFGLTATDAQGKTKDVMTFLGDLADKVQSIEAKGGNAQGLLARLQLDRNTILMLRNGREEFLALYDAAKKGIPFTDEDYKNAEKFTLALRRAKGAVSNIGKAFAVELMPTFEAFLTRFNKWWKDNGKRILADFRAAISEWTRRLVDVIDKVEKLTGGTVTLTKAITLLGAAVGVVVSMSLAKWAFDAVKPIADLAKWAWTSALAFGRAQATAKLLAAGLSEEAAAAEVAALSTAELLLPILAIVAAVALFVGAILLIIDDFRAWREGADSLIGRFQKNFPAAFAFVSSALGYLKQAFVDFWNALKDLWAQVGPVWIWLAKKIAMIAFIIIGVVIAAVLALLYITVLVVTKMLTWYTKLSTFLMKLIPVDILKELWDEFTGWFSSKIDEMTATVAQWGEAIKDIWQDIGDFLRPIIEWLSEKWTALTETSAWEAFAANLKAIWDGIMGWLKPYLDSIGNAIGFVKNIVAANEAQGTPLAPPRPASTANAAAPASSQKTSAPTSKRPALSPVFVPAPFTFAPSSVALAGVAGSGYPPPSISNTQQHSSVASHKTDVKATINVTSPNPDAAGRAVAGHIDKLANSDTLAAQIGHH